MAKSFQMRVVGETVVSEQGVQMITGVRENGDKEFGTLTLTLTGLKQTASKPASRVGKLYQLTFEEK